MPLYFWERATATCYVYVAWLLFVGSAVAAIFDFVAEKDWGEQHPLE